MVHYYTHRQIEMKLSFFTVLIPKYQKLVTNYLHYGISRWNPSVSINKMCCCKVHMLHVVEIVVFLPAFVCVLIPLHGLFLKIISSSLY